MSPRRTLRDICVAGRTPTPEQVCADIYSHKELNGYEAGLKARGALTTDALSAIVHRRLTWGAIK